MPPRRPARERQIVDTKHGDRFKGFSVVYQRELVQCGKAKCRRWHGPYWYAYTRKDGRARSFYVGKDFRTLAELERARR
jgi:hypothetical protein